MTIHDSLVGEVRQDCLLASGGEARIYAGLEQQHIVVTGGTGFLGTWIAEMVAALNDEYQLGISLELLSRNVSAWQHQYPHLAQRSDICLRQQDVRSPFELATNTTYVIHAAGMPNNRFHASDPLRVLQTTILGLNHLLEAAAQLRDLRRLVNVSSCLVAGNPLCSGALTEDAVFPIAAGQLHNVYIDAKRAAESMAAIYRSQFRMPISTIRPFTLTGAYQALDRPWAMNSFMRDALAGSQIRIHGDGSVRRSYLYGSDAAWWCLVALVSGADGEAYNLGSPLPVSHLELVQRIGERLPHKLQVVLNTLPTKQIRQDDLFPDTSFVERRLGVRQTCSLGQIVDKTYRWFSRLQT